MPRPIAPRKIENLPTVTWFKPAGVPMKQLEEVVLTLDEVEAVRLADADGLYQEQVAERMKISRQTVGRILASGRKKIAEALVQGKAIRLDGGKIYTSGWGADRSCCGRRRGQCHRHGGGSLRAGEKLPE